MAKITNRLVPLYRLPGFVLGCIVAVAIAVPGLAHAQEWRFEPIAKLGLVTDDNATLSIRTDDDVQLDGYLLDVLANIQYSSSDITTFFLQPRALIRNYPDNEEFESDDLFLRSQFRHRMQSNTFGFRLNFDQQDIRTAERNDSDLGIEDPDEIPNDDTGLVGIEGDRSRWRVSPYWNYALSSTSSMDIALDYFDVRYDDVFAGILVDYTDSRVNWSYRRAISNITTGILTLTGRRFSPDEVFGIDIEDNSSQTITRSNTYGEGSDH